MKSLGSLFIFLLLSVACMQSTNNSNTEQTGSLADTLHFKKVFLHVEGMTCEGCEKTITTEVSKIEGIAEVNASHLDSLATIMFDTSVANIVLISEKINELGYKVIGEIDR